MTRHVGTVGVKAWGVSNTLASKSGGGFTRSARLNPQDRKNRKVSPGFRADQVDEGTVHLFYVLGDRHGIVSAADRLALIEKHLHDYMDALSGRFKVGLCGQGEQQYVSIQEYPNPAVASTLLKAADRLEKLGDHRTAALLTAWAEKDSNSADW